MGGQGGDGSISDANAGVPASSRKVVQILKEIVNCSDLEIYAMLVECDMDPDETISRLLSQDTFREVKSKRDKKKVMKDPAESWTCNILNRRAKSSGSDSCNTAQDKMGSAQGVHATTHNYWAGSSSTPSVLGCQPPPNSDPTNVEVKKAIPTGSSETVTSSLLPIPAFQSSWVNANPGKRTMADIVKMGKQPLQSSWVNANPGKRTMADIVKMGKQPLHHKNAVMPRSSETQESGSKAASKDEWPSIEKQDVSYSFSSILKPSADSKKPVNQFSEPQHLLETHLVDEIPETKKNPVVSPPEANQVPPALVSNRNLCDNDYSKDSLLDKRHSLEEDGGEDVSADVATRFQKLTTENEEHNEILPKEEEPLVIIHNHIQVRTSMKFDSFGLGFGKASSGLNDNLENTEDAEDNLSFRHPENDFHGQTSYQIDAAARNCHASLDSETEVWQHKPSPQEDHQYNFSSLADYGFENSQQLNHPSETNPHMHLLDNFPMHQGYTGSLPNNLLPSGIQAVREPDFHYLPFPSRYNNATPSSFRDPAISLAETLRAASISPQNAMPDAGQQATAFAQHFALNPYSHHPEMCLGNYGNLIGYSFMPHNYNPYMPSDFQQAFSDGNYQSMLPQYTTQATAFPVPIPVAYGNDSGASSSNNFPLNPSSTPKSYKDVLSSQFKESNHLASSLQQQNENLAVGHQEQQPNSRVISGSGYYSLSGHPNQQPPGLCQVQLQQQHPSQRQQHFGGDCHVSPYHSQAAMSLEHLHHQQQQNARDASKQIQEQSWPNNY